MIGNTELGASEEAPAVELIEAGFALEIADAPLLHRGMNLADVAHVLALAEWGVIPLDAARRLLTALAEIQRIAPEDFPYDPEVGDVYNCRERYLVELLGDDAGWLHAGRPRREAGRIAFRLLLRRLLASLAHDATELVAAVAELATAHVETVMPDQTYLQQAQPSTFGHYVLAFAYPVLRDTERLLEAVDRTNQSPGGAGCVNGSRLVAERTTVARLLGFREIIEHTRDAMWQTDGLVDVMATAASLVTTLSKLSDDLEIWDSQEFDFVDLAGPYTRGSMLMPQKRNPYALAIVRGTAGVLIGRLSGFLAVVKTPSARTDNLIFAYGEVSRSIEAAGRVTRLMCGVIRSLQVNPDSMWNALVAGFSQATDLAEYVMQECELDYRTAYRIVGSAVRTASRLGARGVDLTGQQLDEAAQVIMGRAIGLTGVDLSSILDPRGIALSRTTPGGAAPDVVQSMARNCAVRAVALGQSAQELLGSFDHAEASIFTLAAEISCG
jgi:argininosuccinate lyase